MPDLSDALPGAGLPAHAPDPDPATPISLRALVTSKEAGIIIGRGGQHVAELREKAGVKAAVSRVVPRVHRILTISGTLASVPCAFERISQAFLDQQGASSSSFLTPSPPPSPVTPTPAAPPPTHSHETETETFRPEQLAHLARPSHAVASALPSSLAADSSSEPGPAHAQAIAPAHAEAITPTHAPTEHASPSHAADDVTLSQPTASSGQAVTIRLLIANTLVGTLIGRQGRTIKQIQEMSGSRIVAAKGILPNSTERVIDITGPPCGIQRSIHEVAKYVASEWERLQGTILFDYDADAIVALAGRQVPLGSLGGYPGSSGRLGPFVPAAQDDHTSVLGGLPGVPGSPSVPAPAPYGAELGSTVAPVSHHHPLSPWGPGPVMGPIDVLTSSATASYAAYIASLHHQHVFAPTGIPSSSSTSPAAVATAAAQGAAIAPGGGFVAGGVTGQGPMSAPAVIDADNMRTQNISFPTDMVGCIIGKAGSKITEIRRLSGSRISIAKCPHDETGERLFTIQGTPASNEKALYLLYNQIKIEKERRQAAAMAAATNHNQNQNHLPDA